MRARNRPFAWLSARALIARELARYTHNASPSTSTYNNTIPSIIQTVARAFSWRALLSNWSASEINVADSPSNDFMALRLRS